MLLDRTFLKIAHALIKVDKGSLTLKHNEFKFFFISHTTYIVFSSSLLLLDSSSPSKFGMEVDMQSEIDL